MGLPQRSRAEWKEAQDKLLASYAAVREELLRIPGVVEVGVGLRRRAGRLVEEPVYVVSVREKRPEAALSAEEIIPRAIRGFPTDVETYREPQPLLGFGDENDRKNYYTKVGGIGINSQGASARGTLGCFCRQNHDNSVVLLSNHHVLFAGDAKVGSGVGQPAHLGSWCCKCNEIAKIVKGDQGLDCAIASLLPDVPFYPKIRRIRNGAAVEEEGAINGSADPVLFQSVWKIGARTGLTRGKIIEIAPKVLIFADAAFGRFANRGDSGSVVVEKATGNVVALLHSVTDYATGETARASRIKDVEAVLGVKVMPSDPTATYDERHSGEDEEALPVAPPYEAFAERLRASEAGRGLLALFDRHQAECLHLVRHRRAFTVAWRRNAGPAWVAALGRSARDPIYQLPERIDGAPLPDALRHIAAVLEGEAGEALRRDLRREAPVLIEAAASARTLEELLEQLESRLERT